MTRHERHENEAGSVTLVAMGLVVTLIMLTVAITDLVLLLDAHVKATVAADAAALAAAPLTFDQSASPGNPCDEASAYASANGATLVNCSALLDRTWSERTVEISVSVTANLFIFGPTDVAGSAAAEFRPVDLGQ